MSTKKNPHFHIQTAGSLVHDSEPPYNPTQHSTHSTALLSAQ